MGVDYYNILKVLRTASDEELRKSYKKLAMRWHPDKHPSGGKQLAESKFKQICEAYDVLSDSQKRQIYDLHGEEGLKSSPSTAPRDGGAGGGGGVGGRNGAKGRKSFRYNPRDAEDVFAEFFGAGSDNWGTKRVGGGRDSRTGKKASAVGTSWLVAWRSCSRDLTER